MLKSINESFDKICKESVNVRHYSDMLFDMIEEGMVDAENLAKDLIYWCSEDDIEHYMRVNDLLIEDDIDESVDLVSKDGTIANTLAQHMNELAQYDDVNQLRNKAIEIIKSSEISDKTKQKFVNILFSKKSKSALLSTLGTFMTGDKVIKPGRK